MSRLSSLLILVCIGALLVETFAAPDEPIIVRSKRQQCRCVKNPNGGLTCSCAKGPANGSSSSSSTSVGNGVQYDVPQSADIANQLTQISQQSSGMNAARCGCIQIVFQGAPQYNCQCGDQNGNPLPTSTTMAPTTTSTTTTTTTTTPAPTTTSTTTQAPVSYPQVPTQTQGNNGACNCIMISITSPQTAQYQCQCAQPQQQQQIIVDYEDPAVEYGSQTAIPGTLPAPNNTPVPPTTITTTTPSTTTTTTRAPTTTTTTPYPQMNPSMYTASPPTVYPAIGQLATGQEQCYCLDPTTSIMSGCGCRCNCATLMVTVPNAYCGCPQPGQQQMQYADTYDYTQQVYSTQAPTTTTTVPTTTTQAPTTQVPTTSSPVQYADTTATQYPLTTTCVMYVNVPTTACSCLPQYDQCAQNVCCLKAKYRSYKKAEETQPSTLDVLMNVLQTIKTKLE